MPAATAHGHRGRLTGYRLEPSHVAGLAPGCGPAAAWIPHGGSTVVTQAGIRFPWLETACVGPLERDPARVADQADEAARACPGRPAVPGLCQGLVNTRTAA